MARLTEHVVSPAVRVDRESGVIHNVKVLGVESANRRTYSEAAIKNGVGLYEGSRVNIDHTERAERSFADGFGVLRGARIAKANESAGIYADLHYLKSHPLAEMVLEKAERFPDKFGLSHVADGDTRVERGRVIVESIKHVHSVDVVDRPATNAGLFESERTMKTTLRKLIEATKYQHTAKLVEMLPGELASLPDAEVEVAEEPAGSSPIDAVKAMLADKAREIFMDDSVDPKETGKQVAALAQAALDVAKKVEPALEGKKSEEPPKEGDEPAKESVLETRLAALAEAVTALTAERNAHRLIEAAGGIASIALVERVAKAADPKKFVESLTPAELGKAKPVLHRQPVTESVGLYDKLAGQSKAKK